MNKFLVSATLITFIAGYVPVFAFSEPSLSPPQGNVSAPINMSSQTQSKAGDLELKDLKVRGGVNLGGVFRNSWPAEGAGCTWAGTKCDCNSDESSVGSIAITLGLTCQNGSLANGFRLVQFDISSRDKPCSASPPTGCTAGLYTKSGPTGNVSGFSETVGGVVTAVTSVVVGVVRGAIRTIRNFFRSLF